MLFSIQFANIHTIYWLLVTGGRRREMKMTVLVPGYSFFSLYRVLLPPASDFISIPLFIKSCISLKAVSCEHFAIFAHLELVRFPVNYAK